MNWKMDAQRAAELRGPPYEAFTQTASKGWQVPAGSIITAADTYEGRTRGAPAYAQAPKTLESVRK